MGPFSSCKYYYNLLFINFILNRKNKFWDLYSMEVLYFDSLHIVFTRWKWCILWKYCILTHFIFNLLNESCRFFLKKRKKKKNHQLKKCFPKFPPPLPWLVMLSSIRMGDFYLHQSSKNDNCNTIKEVLHEFCQKSGQRVSEVKSRVFFSPNVGSDQR